MTATDKCHKNQTITHLAPHQQEEGATQVARRLAVGKSAFDYMSTVWGLEYRNRRDDQAVHVSRRDHNGRCQLCVALGKAGGRDVRCVEFGAFKLL